MVLLENMGDTLKVDYGLTGIHGGYLKLTMVLLEYMGDTLKVDYGLTGIHGGYTQS